MFWKEVFIRDIQLIKFNADYSFISIDKKVKKYKSR